MSRRDLRVPALRLAGHRGPLRAAAVRRPLARHRSRRCWGWPSRSPPAAFAPHNRARPTWRSRRSTARRSSSCPRSRRRCAAFAEAGFLAAPHGRGASAACSCRRRSSTPCMAWFQAANVGTTGYALLTLAAANLLTEHGTPEQVETLRAADARGPLLRHDGALRAAGRLQPGRHHDPRRAAGRRHLPAVRPQDVDLRRRPRDGREHRPPGAGAHPGRARRHQGHLAVPGAQAPGRATTARSASATTSCSPASTTRWATAAPSTPRRSSATARSRRAGGPAPSATWSASCTAGCR